MYTEVNQELSTQKIHLFITTFSIFKDISSNLKINVREGYSTRMWQYKQLEELSAKDLHLILKERTKVFVVEQAAAYQEVDDIDLRATHLVKRCKDTVHAYCRVYLQDGKVRIGRVLVPEHCRNVGHGRELMQVALNYITVRYPKREVQIQAEAYLKDFYESFGFELISDIYYEDDIAHYDMLYKKHHQVDSTKLKQTNLSE